MAQFVELDIDQGTDFSFDLDLTTDDGTPINVTGYSFTSSIRKSYYSSSATANLNVAVANAVGGNVIFSMNSATTANIKAGRYLFDVDNYLHTASEEIILKPLTTSKWAGWFDVYNKKFFEELAPIPTEWSGYGAWDFYSMVISNYAKQYNLDFVQYCLHGQIIFEYGCGPLRVGTYNGFSNYYKNMLTRRDVSEQRETFNKNLEFYINKRIIELKQ